MYSYQDKYRELVFKREAIAEELAIWVEEFISKVGGSRWEEIKEYVRETYYVGTVFIDISQDIPEENCISLYFVYKNGETTIKSVPFDIFYRENYKAILDEVFRGKSNGRNNKRY